MRKLLYMCLLFGFILLAFPAVSSAQIAVGVSIRIGPPALPVYPQPVCPAPGYIWTPGYWAYGPAGYYWVPGTWVVAPAVGLLWTPGYWGWAGGFYAWHAGYWGPHVGFYGGINYGFGYGGVGFAGGYWNHGVFAYNSSVANVNTTIIHNTYNKTVIVNNTTVNNVSYNGGVGGTVARPNAAELAAAREQHIAPTAEQTQHANAASTNHALLASVNHGHPAIAATARPGEFKGPGVAAARPAGANAAFASRAETRPSDAGHPTNANLARNSAHNPPPKANNHSEQNKSGGHPEGKSHPEGGERRDRPR